jgi:hypothetical protein
VQPGGTHERYGLFRMGGEWEVHPEARHPNGKGPATEGESLLYHPVNGR